MIMKKIAMGMLVGFFLVEAGAAPSPLLDRYQKELDAAKKQRVKYVTMDTAAKLANWPAYAVQIALVKKKLVELIEKYAYRTSYEDEAINNRWPSMREDNSQANACSIARLIWG